MVPILILALGGVLALLALRQHAREARGALQLRAARERPDDDDTSDVDSLIVELASAPRPVPDLRPSRLRLAQGTPYPETKAIQELADPLEDTAEIVLNPTDMIEESSTVIVDPSLYDELGHN